MSNDGIGSVDMLNNDPKPKSILNNNINLIHQQSSKMPLQRSLTQPQGTIEYTVAENDTITSVAARFHTTPTELARINRRFGQFIFPGQILFVPKSNSTSMSLSADNMDTCGKQQQQQQNHASRAPPNTPNDPLLSQSPTHGGGAAVQQQQQPSPLSNDRLKDSNQSPSSTSTSSSVDQLSPLPGHAQRIVDDNPKSTNNNPPFSAPPTTHPSPPSHLFDEKLKSFYHQQQHHPLNHTASEPVNVIPATPEIGAKKEITATAMVHHQPLPPPPPTTTTAATTMDPADRDCLERFLKINVRYITDGQGVVSGVLLVTPNAMMFDSNVSDPLVMEHGPEMYNVTIPIDLVLKTALYSDIAHMRVKHAPEAVPAVPKPSVYYASDEDTVGGGIVDENLKNVYAQKKNAFDTIGKVSEEKPEDTESSPEPPGQQSSDRAEMDQLGGGGGGGGGGGRQAKVVVEKKPSTDTMNDDDEFKDAVEHQTTTSNNNQPPQQQEDAKTSTSTAIAATIINNNNNQNCDEVHNNNNDDNHSNHETDSDREQNHNQNNDNKWPKDSTTKVISKPTHKNPDCADQSQSLECDEEDVDDNEGDEEEVSLSKFDETEDSQQKRSAFKSVIESMDDDQATSIDQSLDLMTSMDDNDALQLLSTPPLSATVVDHHNKKHSPYMAKISLAERHSAPLQQANHRQNNSNTSGRGGAGASGNDTTTNAGPRSNNCPANNEQEHKPLQSAVSAEETYSDPSPLRPHQRLSAAGENRRGQMLKRLSNPVDAIGNFTKSGISSGINATKSGFNATKTGFSKGLNATQSGINTGFQATKSGLTTGLTATKTGFTKVLSTPKNLMNLTTEFRRDAKGGALAAAAPTPSGSKSDINLQEHYLDSSSGGSGSFDETQQQQQHPQQPGRAESPVVGYCNMVDKKIDAFENFDKLIPRPARVNKDAPLYLCIRMGKYRKDDNNRNRYQQQQPPRYSPTNSFGKKKYEREYWFSVPKEKARNLYHFFKKWAPEIYGDVDDIRGCEQRCLEPINTDDEYDLFDEDIGLLVGGDNTNNNGGNNSSSGGGGNANKNDGKRSSYLRIFSQDKGGTTTTTVSGDNAGMLSGPIDPTNQPADAANNNAKMTANANRQRFWRRSPLHFLKLVEDHFSTDGLSTEWNVSNSSEEHSFAERYHLDTDSNEPILPEMIGTTELLTAEIIEKLSKHLPARAEGYAWTLIYSTSQHGFSLNTLYREMRHFDSPVLLIIEDTNGAKFGALLSHSLRISDHFYGTGETFLFTFHPTFECFPWTGENIFFIKGNFDSIAIGAGEGNFGLWLDGDLYHGSSHPCKTFGNRTLSSEEDFVVKSIECWGFV